MPGWPDEVSDHVRSPHSKDLKVKLRVVSSQQETEAPERNPKELKFAINHAIFKWTLPQRAPERSWPG
jgi:hypothetical protein